MNAAELKKRAQGRARTIRSARRDTRYERVMGRLIAAKWLRTNVDTLEKHHGKVSLEEALWAGQLEPRIFELVPAIVLKKPAFFAASDELPEDLARIVRAIRRGKATEEFRGIPAANYLAWIPRIGHRGKEPTLPKSFRMRQQDLALLRKLAGELGTTETDVMRRGLKALARLHR